MNINELKKIYKSQLINIQEAKNLYKSISKNPLDSTLKTIFNCLNLYNHIIILLEKILNGVFDHNETTNEKNIVIEDDIKSDKLKIPSYKNSTNKYRQDFFKTELNISDSINSFDNYHKKYKKIRRNFSQPKFTSNLLFSSFLKNDSQKMTQSSKNCNDSSKSLYYSKRHKNYKMNPFRLGKELLDSSYKKLSEYNCLYYKDKNNLVIDNV